jgi:hypothetical protein
MRLYDAIAIMNVMREIAHHFCSIFFFGMSSMMPIDTNAIPIIPVILGISQKNIYENMRLDIRTIGDKSQKRESGISRIDL